MLFPDEFITMDGQPGNVFPDFSGEAITVQHSTKEGLQELINSVSDTFEVQGKPYHMCGIYYADLVKKGFALPVK